MRGNSLDITLRRRRSCKPTTLRVTFSLLLGKAKTVPCGPMRLVVPVSE